MKLQYNVKTLDNSYGDNMRLYHGSKLGLKGAISPRSRAVCDFGRGFYMGDTPQQPLTLICRTESPRFYELDFDLEALSVRRLEADVTWALFVAYNRGHLDAYAGTPLVERMKAIADGADVIFGRIANDRVLFAVERFFDGTITVETLTEVLKALNYGNQYCAVTPKACAAVKVVSERTLDETECANLRRRSDVQRQRAEDLTNRIFRERRHLDGTYFDELCERLAKGEPLE